MDHRGQEVGAALPSEALAPRLRRGEAYALLDRPEFREEMLPALMEKAELAAQRLAPAVIEGARREMNAQLEHELQRLKELQKVNRSVRPEEIELLAEQRRLLDQHLAAARLRLDAVRIIHRAP